MPEELQTTEQQPPNQPEISQVPDGDDSEYTRAQLVATAVNSQMTGSEATQLAEAKHMAQEFEKHATDTTLPVESYGIRNRGYRTFKNQYEKAREDRNPDQNIRGVNKQHFSNLKTVDVDRTDADGYSLEDPHSSNKDALRHVEGAVIESEAKLADMPIGPWNKVERRGRGSRHDTLVFSDQDTSRIGSAEYARFARERAKVYSKIAELEDDISNLEEEKAIPSIPEAKRERLDNIIAQIRSQITALEGDGYGNLGDVKKDQEREEENLKSAREKLSGIYAEGAEYYRAVSEKLNDNLNNVVNQFEDFYDLAPEVFAGESSKEFLESAKKYFGLKQDIREAESAAAHATDLTGVYEGYFKALEPDSGTEISANDVGVVNLNRQIGYNFGFDMSNDFHSSWSQFNTALEEYDGEDVREVAESFKSESGYGLNKLATAENLASYVDFYKQIESEWLDLSPRQTLEKFSSFAKNLEQKQKDALAQKQAELEAFVANLKGNQESN